MKKLLLLMGSALGRRRLRDLVLELIIERQQRDRIARSRSGAATCGSTINATGTIEPEEVVDVGAQVAGLIESFGTDPSDPSKPVSYGTRVEQGTVLARLDSALFQARVDQARGRVAKAKADIEQAQAKLRQAERELDRTKKLLARANARRRTGIRRRLGRTTSRPRPRWPSARASWSSPRPTSRRRRSTSATRRSARRSRGSSSTAASTSARRSSPA